MEDVLHVGKLWFKKSLQGLSNGTFPAANGESNGFPTHSNFFLSGCSNGEHQLLHILIHYTWSDMAQRPSGSDSTTHTHPNLT